LPEFGLGRVWAEGGGGLSLFLGRGGADGEAWASGKKKRGETGNITSFPRERGTGDPDIGFGGGKRGRTIKLGRRFSPGGGKEDSCDGCRTEGGRRGVGGESARQLHEGAGKGKRKSDFRLLPRDRKKKKTRGRKEGKKSLLPRGKKKRVVLRDVTTVSQRKRKRKRCPRQLGSFYPQKEKRETGKAGATKVAGPAGGTGPGHLLVSPRKREGKKPGPCTLFCRNGNEKRSFRPLACPVQKKRKGKSAAPCFPREKGEELFLFPGNLGGAKLGSFISTKKEKEGQGIFFTRTRKRGKVTTGKEEKRRVNPFSYGPAGGGERCPSLRTL